MLDRQSVGAALPSVGQRIAGRYIIEAELGRGGMGAVFRAHHETTRRSVAIKWMLPAFADDERAVSRFIREAKLAAAVDHENIVDVYDVGQEEGGFFIIMEFLRGMSLSARLEEGALSTGELLEIFAGVCAGMDVAHQAGIVHRDLKPDNIFLAETRTSKAGMIPKIVDFGVSKAIEPTVSSMRLTGAGIAMGSPHYMSPEQIRSAADVDHRSDVYALGVIAYECLTQQVPFDGDSIASVIVKAVTEEPRPLRELAPHLSPGIIAAVNRAMAKAPENRFDSAGEFFSALAAGAGQAGGDVSVLHSRTSHTDLQESDDVSLPGTSWWPLVALAVAALLVVAVGGAWFVLGRDTEPQTGSSPAVALPVPAVPSAPQVPSRPSNVPSADTVAAIPGGGASSAPVDAMPGSAPVGGVAVRGVETTRTRRSPSPSAGSAVVVRTPTATAASTTMATSTPTSAQVGRLRTTIDEDAL
jgi:serine/threonine protein kinase